MVNIRSPNSFEDCLIELRKDNCIACSYRNMRLGDWKRCQKRVSLKYNGEGVPSNF